MATGKFIGEIETRWLADDREMELLRKVVYEDPQGTRWIAPKGSIVDGASIPRFFWRFIGGPFEGKYRAASVVHDVYCVTRDMPWKRVHAMFYYAMRSSGVWLPKAYAMWLAVRLFGPRWS